MQNFYFHDYTAKLSGSPVHPGCFMMDNNLGSLPANNLVFDHIVCERVAAVGPQEADSGVTIQNSLFSCPTRRWTRSSPTGQWDSCAATYEIGVACRADQSPGFRVERPHSLQRLRLDGSAGHLTGLLFRTGGNFGTFNNVRVVGNVFAARSRVVRPGVSFDSNTFASGFSTCGTNATSLDSGDPFVRSSISTPDHSWSPFSLLDAHASGSPALPTIDRASATSASTTTPMVPPGRTSRTPAPTTDFRPCGGPQSHVIVDECGSDRIILLARDVGDHRDGCSPRAAERHRPRLRHGEIRLSPARASRPGGRSEAPRGVARQDRRRRRVRALRHGSPPGHLRQRLCREEVFGDAGPR